MAAGMARGKCGWPRFPVAAPRQMAVFMTTHSASFPVRCYRTLDDAVRRDLQAYEQWDGKGYPDHLRGEEIGLPARGWHLAYQSSRSSPGGTAPGPRWRRPQAPRDPVRPGGGGPVLLPRARAARRLDQASDWDALLGTEPASRRVGGADLTWSLEAMADLVDMKSPTWGPSRGGGQPGQCGGARALLSRR
jgi:hypothetical protein